MPKAFAALKLTGSELDLILDILVGCTMQIRNKTL